MLENTLPLSLPFAGQKERFILTDEDTGDSLKTEGKNMDVPLCFSHPRQARLLWIRKCEEC